MFQNKNGADILAFWVCDFPAGSAWTGAVDTASSSINGETLTGSASGPAVGTAPAFFSGTATGTWS